MNKGVDGKVKIYVVKLQLDVIVWNIVSTIGNLYTSSHTQIDRSTPIHCGVSYL